MRVSRQAPPPRAASAGLIPVPEHTVRAFARQAVSVEQVARAAGTPSVLVVLKNGRPVRMWGVPARSGQFVVEVDLAIDANAYNWFRAELLGVDTDLGPLQHILYGPTLALTNPIYVGFAAR